MHQAPISNNRSPFLVGLLAFALSGCGDDSGGSAGAPDATSDALTIIDATDATSDALTIIDATDADAPVDAGPLLNLRSLQFDGIDDRVHIPGSASISTLTAMTVEAWVKPLSSTTEQMILGKNLSGPSSQYSLVRLSDGQGRVVVSNANSGCATSAGSTIFVANKWTHIVGTWTAASGTPRLYLDGALVATSGCSGAMGSALNELLLGAVVENGTITKHFAGSIDEVRIWNVARSEAQIQATMRQTLTGTEPGLIGYWSFEEVAGDQAGDLTANANHGRLGSTAGADAADPARSTDVPF